MTSVIQYEPVKRVPAKRKPGRKSEADRAVAREAAALANQKTADQLRKIALYEEQESKRAPQFQIDQKGTLMLLGVLGAVMFLATAVLTADGTISSAALSRFAEQWMGFVLFGAVEVAILVFMLTYYIKGSREKGWAVNGWFAGMIFASATAVGLSAYHVFDIYEFDWTNPDMWVGVGIRLVVSLFFVLVSKALASVLFARVVTL